MWPTQSLEPYPLTSAKGLSLGRTWTMPSESRCQRQCQAREGGARWTGADKRTLSLPLIPTLTTGPCH